MKFNKVRRFLNSIPYINLGGCGISALAMYRWLKKNGYSIDGVGFTLYDRDGFSMDNNQMAIDKKEYKYATSCRHVALRYKGVNIDSEGKVKGRDRYETVFTLDEEFMVHSLNNDLNDWNSYFDRTKYIPKIAKVLGIDLSDVKLNN